MQVTEISAQGLSRQFKVVLPAADLASRLEGELVDISTKVRLNGFRPGKVPMAHLKRLYGRSVMNDIVQNAVNEANRMIVEEKGLKLALEPRIDLAGDQADVERAMEAKGDLAFTIAVETVPEFSTGSFADLVLERKTAEITDADIDKTIAVMSEKNRVYEPRNNDNPWVEQGDKITIDFVGTFDGEPFEGGSGEDVALVVGLGTFIPGFEDKLVGQHIGEKRSFECKFPDNYGSEALAGRTATFDVTVKTIYVPLPLLMDDAFAKGYGFDTIEALRDAIKGQIKQDIDRASRDRIKRLVLDLLDKRYDFLLPEGLVKQEFDNIWRQLTAEQKRTGSSFEDSKTSEESTRADYRRIAERRVKLGLVLAQVGESNAVKIDNAELGEALVKLVRLFPGQEKEVWEHYSKNPQAMNELRAPLFEDKVVDLIVSQAQVIERIVSREDLFDMSDLEESREAFLAGPSGATSETERQPEAETLAIEEQPKVEA